MRDTTERPEAVEAGTVRLVGTGAEKIAAHVSTLLSDAQAYQAIAFAHNPYGDTATPASALHRCLRDNRSFL